MPAYLTDLRHSWRIFRRSPGLAATAVTALALGVGFTATMFSIVHGGTRNLPVRDPESVVAVTMTNPALGQGNLAPRPYEFHRWQEVLSSFEGLAAFQRSSVNLSDDRARPERVSAALIAPDTLSLVGVSALVGRQFGPADAEPGAPAVVILSYELWKSRLAGDPSVVGESIRIGGEPHQIVGVMPEGFAFPVHARMWLPLALDAAAAPGEGPALEVFGRLKTGITPTAASSELRLAMARLAAEQPAMFEGRSGRVFPFVELETPPEIRRGLYLLMLAVSFVLLIACANVANLLLARAAMRSRDTAIRTALGASRGRLVALQVFEAGALASVATVIGLGLASIGIRFFAGASAEILDAYWMSFRIDTAVVVFAGLLGFIAAVAAGLLPALRASSAGVGAILPQSDARTIGVRIGRLGRSLVVAQLAMACGLLALTATFVGTAASLRVVDLPFPADRILTAQLSVPSDVSDDPPRRARFAREMVDALESQPDITRAALVSNFPGRGAINYQVTMADEPLQPGAEAPLAEVAAVTPEFFQMAAVSRVRGRTFTWQDDARAPGVAVVNETFVERLSPDRDVLGRVIELGERAFEIVGVVPSLLIQGVDDPEAAGIYLPVLQARPFAVRVMAATTGPPLDAVASLRQAVDAVDANLPIIEVASLHEAVFSQMAILDALATLFLGFGLGAVFLALIGLYAVLSFSVTTRTKELGVRMALGATRRDVLTLLARQGVRQVGWGLGIGLILAVAISRVIASQIERIPPAGPVVFVTIAGVVLTGAVLATWRPARRALRLEPVQALRED